MDRDARHEAIDAAELLRSWADGDFDGFADSLAEIARPGQRLTAHLREQEGDARRIQADLDDELARLAELTRGALLLVRRAIDLALDPPPKRFVSRDEVIGRLLQEL